MACVWEVIENNIQSFHKHNNHSDECCSCWTDYPSVAGLTKRRIILYSSHLPHKTTFPYLWSTDPEPLWKTQLTCYHWMSSSFIPLLFFFPVLSFFPSKFYCLNMLHYLFYILCLQLLFFLWHYSSNWKYFNFLLFSKTIFKHTHFVYVYHFLFVKQKFGF